LVLAIELQTGPFDHPTLKTVHNWPSGGFDEWFLLFGFTI
jgi:hypothetical protein